MLDRKFQQSLDDQAKWPPLPLAHPENLRLYMDFHTRITHEMYNVTCGSCGCIFHSFNDMDELRIDDPALKLLSVPRDLVPFDFSTGVNILDEDNIMVDAKALFDREETDRMTIDICHECYKDLNGRQRFPSGALANYRWVGQTPDELSDLTWIEEALVARAHLVGKVVRLQNRHSSYTAVKGHLVLIPQDTSRLLDLLPMSPESLADTIRVVWVGDTEPSCASLRQALTVWKQKIYHALK